jgi:UDP-glucose 4-epimerase
MAILVTGGAGYIGSHTCVQLLEAGYEIVILDNFSNSKPMVIKRIKEITGRDFDTVTGTYRTEDFWIISSQHTVSIP